MSEIHEKFKELSFEYSMTRKPPELGTLPAGFCVVKGNQDEIETTKVLLHRIDQRIAPAKHMVKINSNWFSEGINHGENVKGAYRIFPYNLKRHIAVLPTVEQLVMLATVRELSIGMDEHYLTINLKTLEF